MYQKVKEYETDCLKELEEINNMTELEITITTDTPDSDDSD
jgi:hypothetical protein